MKLSIDNKDGLKTNATPVSKDFSIGDPSIIVEILRNKLYSHPIQTLVQEYLCNARDAHREVKQTKPINVTFPTSRAPVFKVRDFGPGLSPQRVEEIFVKYGSSTKRTSNNETGGFGIGAKSAWAYTDSFTVTSYHNGIVYSYIAHIANKSTGTLDLISQSETKEPNGLEIQIAVKHPDINNFCNAIIRATYFWNDSEQPEFSDGYKNEAQTVCKSSRVVVLNPGYFPKHLQLEFNRGNFLVVDGIPYESIDRIDLGVSYNYPVAIYFKTGELEVAASRESVSDNSNNKVVLRKRTNEAYSDLNHYVNEELNKCLTLKDFFDFNKNFNWYPKLNQKKFLDTSGEYWTVSYESLSKTPEKYKNLRIKEYSISYNASTMRSHDYSLDRCPVNMVPEAFFLDDSELPVKNSKRFKEFLQNNSQKTNLFVLFSLIPNDAALPELASKLKLQATSTIPQAKRTPRQPVVKDADLITVNIYKSRNSKSTDGLLINLKTGTREFVYVIRNTENSQELAVKYADFAEFLSKVGTRFCFVSESTAKKIVDNEKFFTIDEFYETLETRLDSDQLEKIQTNFIGEVFGYTYFSQELIKQANNILDGNIRTGLNALKEFKSSKDGGYFSKEFTTKPFRKTLLRNSSTLKRYYLALFQLKRALRRYPLLKLCSEEKTIRSVNDIVFYINSKYNKTNG